MHLRADYLSDADLSPACFNRIYNKPEQAEGGNNNGHECKKSQQRDGSRLVSMRLQLFVKPRVAKCSVRIYLFPYRFNTRYDCPGGRSSNFHIDQLSTGCIVSKK